MGERDAHCGSFARIRQLHRDSLSVRQIAHARVLDGRAEAKLTVLACSAPPDGRAAWTMQLLADELVALKVFEAISDETVRRTLKKTKSSRG